MLDQKSYWDLDAFCEAISLCSLYRYDDIDEIYQSNYRENENEKNLKKDITKIFKYKKFDLG